MFCSSLLLAAAAGYVLPPSVGSVARPRARVAAVQCRIELQSAFGRGNAHLSWNVEDGDIVVYQVGTWLVDNVEVGDGSAARMRFARVDNVQINFTHNCEHGVIRGTAMRLGEDGTSLNLDEEDEIQFGPEQVCAAPPVFARDAPLAEPRTHLASQLVARIFEATWEEEESRAIIGDDLPPQVSSMVEGRAARPPPPPPAAPPPLPWRRATAQPPRSRDVHASLECTEVNARSVIAEFTSLASSMFGEHEQCARVGITGELSFVDLDGPVVLVALRGRFWHRRETVLRNARAYLMQQIPELADVELADPEDELDVVKDAETGLVAEDRRAPDFNGDRETLTYQGIDPDTRGPFPKATGGLRPGGSIFGG